MRPVDLDVPSTSSQHRSDELKASLLQIEKSSQLDKVSLIGEYAELQRLQGGFSPFLQRNLAYMRLGRIISGIESSTASTTKRKTKKLTDCKVLNNINVESYATDRACGSNGLRNGVTVKPMLLRDLDQYKPRFLELYFTEYSDPEKAACVGYLSVNCKVYRLGIGHDQKLSVDVIDSIAKGKVLRNNGATKESHDCMIRIPLNKILPSSQEPLSFIYLCIQVEVPADSSSTNTGKYLRNRAGMMMTTTKKAGRKRDNAPTLVYESLLQIDPRRPLHLSLIEGEYDLNLRQVNHHKMTVDKLLVNDYSVNLLNSPAKKKEEYCLRFRLFHKELASTDDSGQQILSPVDLKYSNKWRAYCGAALKKTVSSSRKGNLTLLSAPDLSCVKNAKRQLASDFHEFGYRIYDLATTSSIPPHVDDVISDVPVKVEIKTESIIEETLKTSPPCKAKRGRPRRRQTKVVDQHVNLVMPKKRKPDRPKNRYCPVSPPAKRERLDRQCALAVLYNNSRDRFEQGENVFDTFVPPVTAFATDLNFIEKIIDNSRQENHSLNGTNITINNSTTTATTSITTTANHSDMLTLIDHSNTGSIKFEFSNSDNSSDLPNQMTDSTASSHSAAPRSQVIKPPYQQRKNCLFCNLKCPTFYSLLMHLRYCHPRVSVFYKPLERKEKEDRKQILREVVIFVLEFPDGGWEGLFERFSRPNGLNLMKARRKSPALRSSVRTELITSRCTRTPLTCDLNEFNESKLGKTEAHVRKSFVFGHLRQYFSSRSLDIKHEDDSDSDDEELTPPWVVEKMEMDIRDFSDVNRGEMDVMVLWNKFVIEQRLVRNQSFGLLCSKFLDTHVHFLQDQNICRNVLLHFTNCYQNNLLSQEDLVLCWMRVNDVIDDVMPGTELDVPPTTGSTTAVRVRTPEELLNDLQNNDLAVSSVDSSNVRRALWSKSMSVASDQMMTSSDVFHDTASEVFSIKQTEAPRNEAVAF